MELGPKHEARSLAARSKAARRYAIADLSAIFCSYKINDDLRQRISSIDTP